MPKQKVIGILGGMGPAATVDIFNRIVNLTPATIDQEHIRIIIDNNPHIPSRVAAILGEDTSPLPTMVEMAQGLQKMGADFIIIPCNTASFYIENLRKKVDIPVFSIVEETTKWLLEKRPQVRIVGLLATEMTLRTGIYQKQLLHEKVELLYQQNHCKIIDEFSRSLRNKYSYLATFETNARYHLISAQQITEDRKFFVLALHLDKLRALVMRAIYGKRGIKAGYTGVPKKLLVKAVNDLKRQGAQVVIVGCTEIPLVLHQKDVKGITLIDPTQILAQRAVEKALGIEIG